MKSNPFLTIWTQPKETVQQFIAHDKLGFSIFLVAIAGISGILMGLQNSGFFLDLSTPLFFMGILAAGIISGLINISLNTLLYTGIGKLYGGRGKMRNMAIAIGPTMIPQIFFLPVVIVYILIYGKLFFEFPEDFSISSMPTGAYFLLLFISIIFSIWTLVISAKAVGIVHGFSSWRGFAVIMTVFGIILVFGLIIGMAIIISLF